jgi:DNA-directed RNA polymerase I subunit RPA2
MPLRAAQLLRAQASGKCQGDNPDSMMHQEVLLPGHLLQQFLKERLQDWQTRLKELLLKDVEDKPSVSFDDPAVIEKAVVKACSFADIGKRMEYLLATGNLVSRSGMGLSQTSGFTIVAEKLNFLRYLSHFRSVHRGAYFQELRTTTVRAPPARHPF